MTTCCRWRPGCLTLRRTLCRCCTWVTSLCRAASPPSGRATLDSAERNFTWTLFKSHGRFHDDLNQTHLKDRAPMAEAELVFSYFLVHLTKLWWVQRGGRSCFCEGGDIWTLRVSQQTKDRHSEDLTGSVFGWVFFIFLKDKSFLGHRVRLEALAHTEPCPAPSWTWTDGTRADVTPPSSPSPVLLSQLWPAFFLHTFLISVHFVHLDLSSLSLCEREWARECDLCTFYCCQSLGAALTTKTQLLC